jgi:hypothetical protein
MRSSVLGGGIAAAEMIQSRLKKRKIIQKEKKQNLTQTKGRISRICKLQTYC